MAAEESTPAIVLRARDYSEADRIVTLLTRNFGKLSGIAKGAKASRRRFERKLEPFSHLTLYFRRRPHGQLVFVTRAEPGPTESPHLDDDLAKMALGSYMLELADAMTGEEGEARAAYDVLLEALAALGRCGATRALRQAYELKILSAAGFGTEFGRCRICGIGLDREAGVSFFVVSRGGVVCGRCRASAPEGAVRIAAEHAMALAHLATAELTGPPSLEDGGADGALAIARFVATILDRRLRSTEFLDSLL